MRLRLLLALLWLAVMVALASTPSPEDPSSGALSNAVHAIQYAVFVLILLSVTRAVLPRLPWAALLVLAAAVALLVGAAQEWYQSFLPHREADPSDLLYDAAGAAGGLLLWTIAAVFRQRRLQGPLSAS